MSEDFGFEPMRGIPGQLCDGERLLWQGAPRWRSVATYVFHVRAVAIYFAFCLAWRILALMYDGRPAADVLVSCVPLMGLAVVALALLTLFAWLIGRTTVYSITSRRVFLRFGIALPITLYLPFKVIGSASLKLLPDGTGSIPLALTEGNKFAYLILWPHARPFRFKRAEPTLRFVPDAHAVAELLARAAAAAQAVDVPLVLAPLAKPSAVKPKAAVQEWPGAPAAA